MVPSKLEQLTNAFLELLQQENMDIEDCENIETTISGMFFDHGNQTYNVNLFECDPKDREDLADQI